MKVLPTSIRAGRSEHTLVESKGLYNLVQNEVLMDLFIVQRPEERMLTLKTAAGVNNNN